MIPDLVNIDYEYELFDPNYKAQKYLKYIKEFEYVYLLTKSTYLFNKCNYEDSYLKHLEKLGFKIPKMTSESVRFNNWWGGLKNLSLEKKLNNKIDNLKIVKELGNLPSKCVIIQNERELLPNLSGNQKWILKNPYLMAGRGFTTFEDYNIPKEIQYPCILNPFFNRILDIGCLIDIKNNSFQFVENTNNLKGQFEGGVIYSDINQQLISIEKRFGTKGVDAFYNLRKILIELAKNLKEEYGIDKIQVDSFLYTDGKGIHLYPIVELNYRKTMGIILLEIMHQLKSNKIEWCLTNNTKKGYELSPKHTKHRSFIDVE